MVRGAAYTRMKPTVGGVSKVREAPGGCDFPARSAHRPHLIELRSVLWLSPATIPARRRWLADVSRPLIFGALSLAIHHLFLASALGTT
jgi:hypothetical protein